MLLHKGMPVHQVAARIGDDPAVLLRVYGSIPTPNSNCTYTGSNHTGTTIGAGPPSRRFGITRKQLPRQPPRRRFLQHEVDSQEEKNLRCSRGNPLHKIRCASPG